MVILIHRLGAGMLEVLHVFSHYKSAVCLTLVTFRQLVRYIEYA